MKGNPVILDHLAVVLGNEMVALNQYYLHAKMLKNWGFIKLSEKMYKESIEEMIHADKLIERILFLEGRPVMEVIGKLAIGTDVPKMFHNDLKLELKAINDLKAAIHDCDEHKDYVSQSLFQNIIDQEDPHVEWLESQLKLIESVGLENYLQSQIV
jgi:bacterioferritin